MTSSEDIGKDKILGLSRRITPPLFVENLAIECFDRAQRNGMCGVEML